MTVQVAARPDAVTFEPATAAVVVVDMQHDFASRDDVEPLTIPWSWLNPPL